MRMAGAPPCLLARNLRHLKHQRDKYASRTSGSPAAIRALVNETELIFEQPARAQWLRLALGRLKGRLLNSSSPTD